MKINIAGLDKAELLAALYNNSKPQGMGFLQYDSKIMTKAEAQSHLATQETPDYPMSRRGMYFDYLKGRVLKVDLAGDELDTWGYDRDLGEGAAQRAIDSIRR